MQKKLNSIIISYTCAAAITLFNLQIFAMQQWFMYISTFIYIYAYYICGELYFIFWGKFAFLLFAAFCFVAGVGWVRCGPRRLKNDLGLA